jgi:hypothetical protein
MLAARRPRNSPESSLNGPKRKLFSCFNARILKVNEIKVPGVKRTHERFVHPEDKGFVGASISRESNSNGYSVLVALPVDSKNFCGNGGQRYFLPLSRRLSSGSVCFRHTILEPLSPLQSMRRLNYPISGGVFQEP